MKDRQVNYGEIKVKRNVFPKEAQHIAEKGKVRILFTQSKPSDNTKKILDEHNIILYEGLTPSIVSNIRKRVKKTEQRGKARKG